MNTPVSFELAELLKEKGFNVSTYKWFYSINGLNGKENSRTMGKSYLYNHSKRGKLYYSAPTIAEVVMWIYEKYGIWIFSDFGLGWENFTIPCGYNGNATTKDLHYNGQNFNSPTEAYETAIKYVLETLI